MHIADYDNFAWFFNYYWSARFINHAMTMVLNLMVPNLPIGARLLDLCCGTGQLANKLCQHGFRVTGLDASEPLLRYGRENAPSAEFICGDARYVSLPAVYDGAVSTFDSLNHMMTLEELTVVFGNIHAALVDGGIFVFDMNLEEGYRSRGQGVFAKIEDETVFVVQGSFDPDPKTGRYDITLFRKDGEYWQRSDGTFIQKCYAKTEVRSALGTAGFMEIQIFDAERDMGMTGQVGRAVFCARKPSVKVEDPIGDRA